MEHPDWLCGGATLAVSRRIFLQRGFFAAAACAGSPLLALNGGRHLQVNDGEQSLAPTLPHQSNNWQDHAAALDGLDRNMFAAAVGSNFKVYLTSGSPVWLTLLAVEDLPATAPANPGSFAVSPKGPSFAPSSNGFVLVFGGSTPIPPATHLLEHDNLGRFALFSEPSANGQGTYTAVINRLENPIVAVPFSAGHPAQNNPAHPVTMNAAPATVSGIESPSRALSGSPGARRSVLKD